MATNLYDVCYTIAEQVFSAHAKVVELIDPIAKGWNASMLKRNLWAEEAGKLSSRFRWASIVNKMFWFGGAPQ
jgi:hypothetical protein